MSGAAGVRLRRARPADADFLASLMGHADVQPYLSPRSAAGREELLERIERSEREPGAYGLFVIEVGGEPAGTCQFELANERHRIARLGALAVHPDFRGRRVADLAARLFQRLLVGELGFHRLELEVYGFNERALEHAERAGFVREGVKRKAYLRDGVWVDGVCFGLVAEDLDNPPPDDT